MILQKTPGPDRVRASLPLPSGQSAGETLVTGLVTVTASAGIKTVISVLIWDDDPKEQKRMGRTVPSTLGLGNNSFPPSLRSTAACRCGQERCGFPEVQICLKKGKKEEAALYCSLEFVPISTSFLLQVSGSFSIRQV